MLVATVRMDTSNPFFSSPDGRINEFITGSLEVDNNRTANNKSNNKNKPVQFRNKVVLLVTAVPYLDNTWSRSLLNK